MKNEKHQIKNSKIDRLAQPKNRTEPYKSKNDKKLSDKENSRSKSPNQNYNKNNKIHEKHANLKNKLKNNSDDVKVEVF